MKIPKLTLVATNLLILLPIAAGLIVSVAVETGKWWRYD